MLLVKFIKIKLLRRQVGAILLLSRRSPFSLRIPVLLAGYLSDKSIQGGFYGL
jgi:hypothetical protein